MTPLGVPSLLEDFTCDDSKEKKEDRDTQRTKHSDTDEMTQGHELRSGHGVQCNVILKHLGNS